MENKEHKVQRAESANRAAHTILKTVCSEYKEHREQRAQGTTSTECKGHRAQEDIVYIE